MKNAPVSINGSGSRRSRKCDFGGWYKELGLGALLCSENETQRLQDVEWRGEDACHKFSRICLGSIGFSLW